MKIKKRIVIASLLLILTAVISLALAFIIKSGNERYTYSTYPLKYQKEVEVAAEKYNVDKYLIYGVIKTESNFDPSAVSSAGALGLMQIMPVSFEWIQTMYPDEEFESLKFEDLEDPALNIDYGTHLLSILLDMYEDEETAVCTYNAGLGNVNGWLADPRYSSDGKTLDVVPIDETSNYRSSVMRNKSVYKRLYGNEEMVSSSESKLPSD